MNLCIVALISVFVEVPPVFIHVSPWQEKSRSFTVTRVSGYATTHAWQTDVEDLDCAEAAALLGIPPAALERWTQQLAFPHDVSGGVAPQARFKRAEIEALRDALVQTHSVEGAVRAARERARS